MSREPQKCRAKAKKSGQRCRKWAVPGATVCEVHGGKAPQVIAAAARRLREQEAREAVTTYGLPRDIDPGEALLEEVCRTAGHVAWLEDVVRGLHADDLVWGKTEAVAKEATEFPGTDTTEGAEINVWLQLYRAERKHLLDVCGTALKLGIEERRVRLAEQQGAVIADVIRRLLDDTELGLTAAQKEAGRAVASRHLRVLSATA